MCYNIGGAKYSEPYVQILRMARDFETGQCKVRITWIHPPFWKTSEVRVPYTEEVSAGQRTSASWLAQLPQ